jgi:hypothetical protein
MIYFDTDAAGSTRTRIGVVGHGSCPRGGELPDLHRRLGREHDASGLVQCSRSPGGSHVSLLRYVQFPIQSAKFPAAILREFRGNTLNLFADAEGRIAHHQPQAANFPVFSRETGNSETETGSPMTASTANGVVTLSRT